MFDPPRSLGPFLKQARNDTGLSLRGVEAETGVSNAYLSQIESGKVRQPAPPILHKLCELYGVAYADAMQHAGYPLPSSPTQQHSSISAAARLGDITPEEEEQLIEYLDFIRHRKRR